MSVIGHSKWCDRKGKLANMSGNYCSTCGQVVLLKTGKTDEEKDLAEQLRGAVQDNERLRSTIAQLTADRDSWKALAGELVEQRDAARRGGQ